MNEMSQLLSELAEQADTPVGRMPDITPVSVAAGRHTCDPCSCRVSRCSGGSRCCL